MRILVVEDDAGIADGLRTNLQQRGYAVDVCDGVAAAWGALRAESFDAVLLDLGLADGDGSELLHRLRTSPPRGDATGAPALPDPATPVLIVTARDQVSQRIAGLDQGADDYLVKPFDVDELDARLRALLRRAAGRASPTIRYGDIEVDPAARTVVQGGKPVEMSPREFSVLLVLLQARGRVLSRQQLEERLYSWQSAIESNAVEVHIHHLRRKLGSGCIQTMRGVGYLALVWASFVFIGYRTGLHEADELTDGHLASVAALLVKLRASQAVEASSTTQPTVAPWLKSHDYQQSISVVQWDAAGRVLVHSGSAPLPAFDAAEGFADLHLGPEAMAWRSFSQWDAPKTRKVMVLLESRERDELARDIAGQMIEPGLWLLPVVALALGLALRRGLRPLYALSADVAALDPASTQRLASRHAWSEFESVVASINTLLDRQQDALVRERRLANEVAHELRTPLSSIALQASALGGGLDPQAQAQAVTQIGQDALRAGHVLNQLLALARASRAQLHEAKAPVDLAATARAVCADYAQAAWKRGGEIALVAPDTLELTGHAVLLDLAVRNLVENALKHTPPGTRISVQIGQSDTGAAWLQVCDDGRRVQAAGGNAKVARPVDSLHLGHEIVLRVAQMHGGDFGAAAAPAPFTTCFRLDFPPPVAAQAG